jgi:hypothetical protein
MPWRRPVYVCLALYILSAGVLVEAAGPLAPETWPSLAVQMGLAAALLVAGLDALLAAPALLDWIRTWRPLRSYRPATWTIRVGGAILVLGGTLRAGATLWTALTLTGILQPAQLP